MLALILQQLPGGYKCCIESRESRLFGENASQDAHAVIAGPPGPGIGASGNAAQAMSLQLFASNCSKSMAGIGLAI
jgi:hypothetical protein